MFLLLLFLVLQISSMLQMTLVVLPVLASRAKFAEAPVVPAKGWVQLAEIQLVLPLPGHPVP